MEENKKQIRIGKVTFGIVMIFVGVIIMLATFTSIEILRYALMLWPLILVALGVETLVYSKKDNIKYDIAGGIFTFILVGIIGIFSIINYGVNKILFDKEIYNAIINERSVTNYVEVFKDKVTIQNVKDNPKVNIKINEIEGKEQTTISIKVQAKKELSFTNMNFFDYIYIDNKKAIITILDTFEEYEYINILITTSSKDNIIIE
ncbi:MAG: hypothetical protein E7311_02780 [Clostridiales bacterium]|nr:hypothetical protein [Clostridiales bacterium]